jgi:DNA-binding NtrC family response regulator
MKKDEIKTKNKIRVFVIDDDEFSLENIILSLKDNIYDVTATSNSDKALQLLSKNEYDIAILDLKLHGTTGLDIIEKTTKKKKLLKFILITGYSEEEAFIRATRIGVSDILKKPYEEFQLRSTINRLMHIKTIEEENIKLQERLQTENKVLREQVFNNFEKNHAVIIGNSPPLLEALKRAKSVAEYSLNALIVGETGTGKELIAQYIHRNGDRKDKPFIAVNCATLPESLAEASLFGYRQGAFTDARQGSAGYFEAANGGVLFLDEITEMPIMLQSKLLRAIQEKKIMRVGETKETDVDVQIISSTNRNVHEAINKGFLREDLYYRIATTIIELPPLRERKEDLYDLVNYFLDLYQKEKKELPQEIWEHINNRDWFGNIRELANFIKNYVVFGTITHEHYLKHPEYKEEENKYFFKTGSLKELEDAKYWLINKALKKFDGNKTLAAKELGLTYQGLKYLLENIERKTG